LALSHPVVVGVFKPQKIKYKIVGEEIRGGRMSDKWKHKTTIATWKRSNGCRKEDDIYLAGKGNKLDRIQK